MRLCGDEVLVLEAISLLANEFEVVVAVVPLDEVDEPQLSVLEVELTELVRVWLIVLALFMVLVSEREDEDEEGCIKF